MSHLTFKQIQDLADRSDTGDALLRHVADCRRCAREVAIQRSLARAAKEAPVVKTSASFTRKIMESVDPGSRQTRLFRVLGGTGNVFAMVLVLAIVGYALVLSPGTSGATSEPSAMSKLLTEYYGQLQQVLVQASGTMKGTIASQAPAQESKIFIMMIASILILLLLDRFVLGRFLHMRR